MKTHCVTKYNLKYELTKTKQRQLLARGDCSSIADFKAKFYRVISWDI